MNNNRTFGVEIECGSSMGHSAIASAIEQALHAAGHTEQIVRTTCYGHATDGTNYNRWEVKPDGSLRFGFSKRGVEVVSPVLKGRRGIEMLQVVLNVVNQHCVVNKSCGLHVHHGVDNHGELVKVADAWRRIEGTVLNCLPRSRRDNSYCKRWSRTAATRQAPASVVARDIASNGRYYTLNLSSYTLRKTVEFRCHSGSTEATKVINWVLATQAIVEHAVDDNLPNPAHGAGIGRVVQFIRTGSAAGQSTSNETVERPTFRKEWRQRVFDMIASHNYTREQIISTFTAEGMRRDTVSILLSDARNPKYQVLKLLAAVDADGYFYFPALEGQQASGSGADSHYAQAAEWLQSRYDHFQNAA